ncbi:MAG: L-seryl-tRNA(Sec) selenium transferase [Mycobacterium sp.]
MADPVLADAVRKVGAKAVKTAVASAQQRARNGEIGAEDVVAAAIDALPSRACGLRPVINATGVLVHTNLGRAPLSAAAVKALAAAAGYVDVELDLASGRRASRRGRTAMAALLAAVPAAEAVHVVNNNAAALVLVAAAFAAGGKEIIISRGELVAIGDGFRLPDLLVSTGARLREVGTTNRSTVADYAAAITAETGFILKVHRSNFRVEGFVGEATVAELAELDPPVVADIGSGLLRPEPLLSAEPDAATTLAAGADVVTASGDKLLGGPQAGLLLGRAGPIAALRRHPLARALRVDKLTLAALEATLTGPPPPLAQSLSTDVSVLRSRAITIAGQLGAEVVDSEAVVGGGGAPGVVLPSCAVAVPADLAAALRAQDPAVLGRVKSDQLLLDLRTVDPDQDSELIEAVRRAGQPCR